MILINRLLQQHINRTSIKLITYALRPLFPRLAIRQKSTVFVSRKDARTCLPQHLILMFVSGIFTTKKSYCVLHYQTFHVIPLCSRRTAQALSPVWVFIAPFRSIKYPPIGWNDGKIRAFGPETGRLQFLINDTHKGAVTALAVTKPINEQGEVRLISGGDDGQVRVWIVSKNRQILETSMKEHKGKPSFFL